MNDFLITNLWWIVLLAIVVLAGGAFLIYFLVRSKKGKGVPAKEASEALVGAIGGMENVIDHSLAGSRITLRLKDDRKVEEPGLVAFCQSRGVPFVTYSPEELAALEGDFTPSAFG